MISRQSIAHGLPLLCAIVLLLCSHDARAGLVIDLRLAETGGKQFVVTPADVGRSIPINVYAVVTGSDPNAVEGFELTQGAFISDRDANGGVLGQIHPAGDLDEATFTIRLPAISPYNGNGSNRGASMDMPLPGAATGDGVIDLGDDVRRSGSLGELVVFNANSMQVSSGAVIPNGREFHLGRLEFEIGDIQGVGNTEIHWFFRQNADGSTGIAAALFRQDGAVGNGSGDVAAGAPITFSAIPEPAALAALPIASALLIRRRR